MIRGAQRLSLTKKSGSVYYRRLDVFLRTIFPSTFVITLTFLITGVINPAGKESLVFAVATGTVFYWSIFRPSSMSAAAVFAVGIIIELLNFSPPGTMLFALLVVHGIAHVWCFGLRGISLMLNWALIAFLSLCLSLIEWFVSCATTAHVLPLYPAFFQAVMTAGIYPVLAALFGWSRRVVTDADTV